MLKADVVIIGSEGAGARAAIEVARHGVKPLVLTKGPIGKSGATITAMADFEVDSPQCKRSVGTEWRYKRQSREIFEDTLISGGYLNNQKMLERHVTEIPAIAKEMIDKGMKVEKDLDKAAGQSYPRSVITTGHEFMKPLIKMCKKKRMWRYTNTLWRQIW